jgi:hypothetical protein
LPSFADQIAAAAVASLGCLLAAGAAAVLAAGAWLDLARARAAPRRRRPEPGGLSDAPAALAVVAALLAAGLLREGLRAAGLHGAGPAALAGAAAGAAAAAPWILGVRLARGGAAARRLRGDAGAAAAALAAAGLVLGAAG